MLKDHINITAIKLALAFFIAFIINYFYPTDTDFWSLVTIAAITQVGFDNTLSKSMMRFLGTILGALLGYLFALLIHGHIFWLMLVFFVGLFATSVIAMQRSNITYAGVIAGITIVIVLSSSLLNGQLVNNALFRSIEVIIGIVILLIINLALLLILRPDSRSIKYFVEDLKKTIPNLSSFEMNQSIFFAALKISLACTCTFAAWLWFQQPEGFWATIACLLIMEESLEGTKLKGSLRIMAHFLAASMGVICALLIGDHTWALAIPLLIGGYYFGYLISLKNKYSPLGNTAGIALVIMLLVAPGTASSLHIIFWRFTNVMLGVIIGVFITQYFFRAASE